MTDQIRMIKKAADVYIRVDAKVGNLGYIRVTKKAILKNLHLVSGPVIERDMYGETCVFIG